MEADRTESLQDITEPHQLKNQKGIPIKSDSAPALAFLYSSPFGYTNFQ
jgi:hypothetical protein